MEPREKILCFITTLRQTWVDMEALFMDGQNDAFHRVLKAAFSDYDWQYWYDPTTKYVYSKYGNHWYDIRGEHASIPEACVIAMDIWDTEIQYDNGYRETRRLIDVHYETT